MKILMSAKNEHKVRFHRWAEHLQGKKNQYSQLNIA